jgi:hypothetical protein
VDHGVVGELDPVPARIAVHGVVAAADHPIPAAAELVHLLLNLGEIAFCAPRQSVAPVEEGMHDHVSHFLAGGEF